MKLENLMRVLVAAHYSSQVQCPPQLSSRGGIFLVAPTAGLKTSIIRAALEHHTGCLGLSDLNVQGMGRLRHNISNGKIQTLMFYEFAKLYQRDLAVSGNLEGIISGLVEEGFHKLAFDVQEAHSLPCHSLVIGAVPPDFYEKKLRDWLQTGFARRFIWVLYRLDNPRILQDAISRWEAVSLTSGLRFRIPTEQIPYTTTRPEAREIQSMLAENHGLETPAILLQKIASVLRWENKVMGRKTDDTMEVIRDFGEGLSKHGGRLTLK